VNDNGPVPSDADLMARMVVGDQEAFALVYDRHVDVVFGSVLRFIGDREAAEEIVQDAYLAAWRRAAQYSPGAGTVLGWLLGIARNRSIDRMRAASRRPRLVGLGDASEGAIDEFERTVSAWRAGNGEPDTGPETATVRAWERAVVRSALASMPPSERRPLELAYDEGLTQAEVATRLGWPLGTVKTRTRRGLATLRTALQGVPELVPTVGPRVGTDETDGAAVRPRQTMGGRIGPR
jgi:RNA polymerase sigma-70 factor, ECF subfamily